MRRNGFSIKNTGKRWTALLLALLLTLCVFPAAAEETEASGNESGVILLAVLVPACEETGEEPENLFAGESAEIAGEENAGSEIVPEESARTREEESQSEEIPAEDTTAAETPAEETYPAETENTEPAPEGFEAAALPEEEATQIAPAEENAPEEIGLETAPAKESAPIAEDARENTPETETAPENEQEAELPAEENPETAEGIVLPLPNTEESSRLSGSIEVIPGANGQYTARFTLELYNSETGRYEPNAYTVTGFSSAADAEEYARSLAAYGTGVPVSLTDGSLTDAEKLRNTSVDSNLCWAASCADMLTLSGWGEAAGSGFASEDVLLDYYADAFTNVSGNQQGGLLWFFEGVNIYQRFSAAAHVRDGQSIEDGLLAEYCADDMITTYDLRFTNELNTALESLTGDGEGDVCALGLIVGYYDRDMLVRRGGHAVTVMGYATNEAGICTQLVLADSDNSCVTGGTDRTAYPNTYTAYSLECVNGYRLVSDFAGSAVYNVALDTAYTLKYYTESTAAQKEQGGTCNAVEDPDAAVCEVHLNAGGEYYITKLRTNENLSASVTVVNHGAVNYYADPDVLYVLMKDGEEYARVESNAGAMNLRPAYTDNFTQLIAKKNTLEPGEYSLVCILDPEHTVQEAYYNNNTYTLASFLVYAKKHAAGTLFIVPENGGMYYAHTAADYRVYIKNTAEASAAVFRLSNMLDPATGSDRVLLTDAECTVLSDGSGNLQLLFSADYMASLPMGETVFEVVLGETSYRFTLTIR